MSGQQAITAPTVTAAIAWLRHQLAGGPVASAKLHAAASNAGISRSSVKAAADVLNVHKSGGRFSRWALPEHAPAEPPAGVRRCNRCGEEKPLAAFSVQLRGRGGRGTICIRCDSARKRRCEQIVSNPDCVPAVNLVVGQAPDPWPAVQLRQELERQRDLGRSFRSAWPVALHAAVSGLPFAEAAGWRRAFTDTRPVWHASFQRVAWPANRRPGLFVADDERHAA